MNDNILPGSKITVDLDLWKALNKDAIFLQCLIDNGVDSWDGYDLAKEAYQAEVDE